MQTFKQNYSVAIITPTTGHHFLKAAMDSVGNQSYKNIIHYIVVDGESYTERVASLVRNRRDYDYKIIQLPQNTGRQNYYGHRIYAAFSYLLSEDYVLFLDEDNWFESNHVESLLDCVISNKLDWAYSLRRIFSNAGEYICDDNCESLGLWEPFSGRSNLVDTNCYMISRELLALVGYAWYSHEGGDRIFYRALSFANTNFKISGLYTVCYRLSENRLPTGDFFKAGNDKMFSKYNSKYPWSVSDLTSKMFKSGTDISIEPDLVNFIGNRLGAFPVILELGSGKGTDLLLEKGFVLSIEHDIDFSFIRSENHLCIYAPIKDDWYDAECIIRALQLKKPSILLIDGPSDKLRWGIIKYYEIFSNLKIPIVIDDIELEADENMLQVLCNKLHYTYKLIRGRNKQFAYCESE